MAATALKSLPFDALAIEAYLGTSFYFMTFLEDETFLTTVTFSVFLADTFGFLTGAGLFLVLAATTSFFLGLATCFFSIFFDAFLIYKAFLSEALDFDSLLGLTTLDSLDLDSFCFESFDILLSKYCIASKKIARNFPEIVSARFRTSLRLSEMGERSSTRDFVWVNAAEAMAALVMSLMIIIVKSSNLWLYRHSRIVEDRLV